MERYLRGDAKTRCKGLATIFNLALRRPERRSGRAEADYSFGLKRRMAASSSAIQSILGSRDEAGMSGKGAPLAWRRPARYDINFFWSLADKASVAASISAREIIG